MAGIYRRRGTLGVESGENMHPQPLPSRTVNEEKTLYRPKRQTTTHRASQPPVITTTPDPPLGWYDPGPETFDPAIYGDGERSSSDPNASAPRFSINGSGWPIGQRGPEGPLTPDTPGPWGGLGTQDPGETVIDPQSYPNREPAQPPGGPPGGSPPGGNPSSASDPDQSMVPERGKIQNEGFRPDNGDGKHHDDMENWNEDKKNSKSAKSGKYFVIIPRKYHKGCSVFTTENGRKRQVTLQVGSGGKINIKSKELHK